jgi:GT2 family glycosyltransferase
MMKSKNKNLSCLKIIIFLCFLSIISIVIMNYLNNNKKSNNNNNNNNIDADVDNARKRRTSTKVLLLREQNPIAADGEDFSSSSSSSSSSEIIEDEDDDKNDGDDEENENEKKKKKNSMLTSMKKKKTESKTTTVTTTVCDRTRELWTEGQVPKIHQKLNVKTIPKELPKYQPPKCYKQDRIERVRLAMISLRIASAVDGEFLRTNVHANLPKQWKTEVIFYEDDEENVSAKRAFVRKTAQAVKDGKGYAVYATSRDTDARIISRLLRLSTAETVLLMYPASSSFSMKMLSVDWIRNAEAILARDVTLVAVFSEMMNSSHKGFERSRGSLFSSSSSSSSSDKNKKMPIVLAKREALLRGGYQILAEKKGMPCANNNPNPNDLLIEAIHNVGGKYISMNMESPYEVIDLVGSKRDNRDVLCGPESLDVKPAALCDDLLSSTGGFVRSDHGNNKKSDKILASIVLQYYHRPKAIASLPALLSGNSPVLAELLINNDSRSSHEAWMKSLRKYHDVMVNLATKNSTIATDSTTTTTTAVHYSIPYALLVHSPDVHEIRAYNRLGRAANGPFVAFIQDDDRPTDPNWLARALTLFNNQPKMSMLGGHAGRLDTSKNMEVKRQWGARSKGYRGGPTWQNLGEKYGSAAGALPIKFLDPKTEEAFMWAYKVNSAPLIVRTDDFIRVGLFHPMFSCPGEMGIGFDFEFSIRLWKNGLGVGLYSSGFKDGLGGGGSTRSNPTALLRRMVAWRSNNILLYYCYPNFHHEKGTKIALAWNKELILRRKKNKPSLPVIA